MDAVEAREGYILLRVRVQPKASRTAFIIEPDGRLRVAVTEPPVGGAANRAVAGCVATAFAIPRRSVTVVRGEKSRHKTLRLQGLDLETARGRLENIRKVS